MNRRKNKGLEEIVIFFIIIGAVLVIMAIGSVIYKYAGSKKGTTITADERGTELALVIEKDGIKVYRFYDKGHYRYFVDARGKTMSTNTITTTTNQVIPRPGGKGVMVVPQTTTKEDDEEIETVEEK